MTRPRTPFAGFFGAFALVCVLALIPAGLSGLLIVNAGETKSYREIVAWQQETGGIWGSALTGNFYRYKMELVREREPEILVLGSSTSMPAREEFFKGQGTSNAARPSIDRGNRNSSISCSSSRRMVRPQSSFQRRRRRLCERRWSR